MWVGVAGELFFHRPVIVVAHEDAVAIAVETERDAEAAQQAAEQAEIAARIFGGEEFGDEDFACGVVEKAEQGKLRAAIFQPAVQAGVEQQHFAFASAGQAALAMRGSATFAGRADAGRAQQTAKGLAPEREAFLLDQFFAEVMVVEAGIGACGPDAGCGRARDPAGGGGWVARGWRVPEPPHRPAVTGL